MKLPKFCLNNPAGERREEISSASPWWHRVRPGKSNSKPFAINILPLSTNSMIPTQSSGWRLRATSHKNAPFRPSHHHGRRPPRRQNNTFRHSSPLAMDSNLYQAVNQNQVRSSPGCIHATKHQQPRWTLGAKPREHHHPPPSQLRYIPPDKKLEASVSRIMAAEKIGKYSEWSIEVEFLVARERRNNNSNNTPKSSSAADKDKDKRWACPADARNPYEACAKRCAELVLEHGVLNLHAVGGVAYRGDVAPLDDDGFQRLLSSGPRPGLAPSMCHWFFSPAPSVVPNRSSPDGYDWIGLKMRCPFRSIETVIPGGDAVLKALHDARTATTTTTATKSKPKPKKQHSENSSPSYASSAPTSSDEDEPAEPKNDHRLEMETLVGLLRAGIKIHTNSTCQLRYYFTHRPSGMTLATAKRMVAMCWMLERDLLLPLRPDVRDRESNHFLPITTASRIAREPTRFPSGGYMEELPARCDELLAETRPRGTVDQASLDANVPRLNDSCLQERINMIWSADTFRELAESIGSPDGETTVAIHVPTTTATAGDDENGDTAAMALHPVLELRYTVWHPQVETMRYWLQLLGRIFYFAAGAPADNFRKNASDLDVILLTGRKLDAEDRWKPLLTHGLENVSSYYWEQLKRHERQGGSISPSGLDSRGILRPVPGIQLKASPSDSASSSSS